MIILQFAVVYYQKLIIFIVKNNHYDDLYPIYLHDFSDLPFTLKNTKVTYKIF
jgi:hypothetical protein